MNRIELNLRAGAKFLTVKPDGTAGEIVTLEEITWDCPMLRSVVPLRARCKCQPEGYMVTPHGEIYGHDTCKLLYQITGEYREPTIAERLEKFRARHWTTCSVEEFAAIVADVRKLEGERA